jgi:AcrR family transcriptional regulator
VTAAPDARPRLRTDARRNRRRLLEAAREVMREQGLDASLGQIARRAGVGSATLYRHFPTREALCESVFVEYGNDLERIRERVLQIPDPWDALVAWLEETCTAFSTDQAFAELVAHGMPQSPTLNDVCLRAIRFAGTLLHNAQCKGVVRSDIELTDLLLVVYSLQHMVPAAASVAPDAWRRHLTIALDGLRPWEGASLPASAVTFDQAVELGERMRSGPRRQASHGPADCRSPGAGADHPSGDGAISDELWELIAPELPSSEGRRGRPWGDHRQTLEAILWRYRTGCPWRDVPAEFGPWQTLWKRHRRWSADGVYQRILERLMRS